MKKTLLTLSVLGLVAFTSCEKAKEAGNAVVDTTVDVAEGTTDVVTDVAEGTTDAVKGLFGFDFPTFEGNEGLTTFVTKVKDLGVNAKEALATKDVAKIAELTGQFTELKTEAKNLSSGLSGDTLEKFNSFAGPAIQKLTALLSGK